MKLNLYEILLLTIINMLKVLLAYTVVFGAKLHKNKLTLYLTCFCGLLLQTVVYFFVKDSWSNTIELIYLIAIPLFCFDKIKRKWLALYPFIYIGLSSFDIFGSYIVSLILKKPEADILYSVWPRIICECFSVSVLLALLIFYKLTKRRIIEVTLNIGQYLLLFSGIMCSVILNGIEQLRSSGEELTLKMQTANGLALSFICLIFIIVCLWHGIIMNQRREYKYKTESYEKYMKQQEEQIHKIIDNDTQMRQFRHDIQAHINALRGYLNNQTYDKLDDYLDNMENSSLIKQHIKYTGDTAIDAVINEYIAQANSKNISVTHKILYDNEINAKAFDMCSIISNIFKNAIEACEKIENADTRFINFKMLTMDNFLQIIAVNSTNEEIKIINNELKTSKKDKLNHGLGTEIIKKTVEKYEGKVDFTYDNEVKTFTVSLLLPVSNRKQ